MDVTRGRGATDGGGATDQFCPVGDAYLRQHEAGAGDPGSLLKAAKRDGVADPVRTFGASTGNLPYGLAPAKPNAIGVTRFT